MARGEKVYPVLRPLSKGHTVYVPCISAAEWNAYLRDNRLFCAVFLNYYLIVPRVTHIYVQEIVELFSFGYLNKLQFL